MRIRPAVPEDVPQLGALLAELGYAPPATAIRGALDRAGTTVLVAEEDDAPGATGLLALTCRPVFHRGAVVASIDSLVVTASHRSRGVGAQLVAAARGVALAAGAVLLELDSNRARADARRFYERLGFELTSHHFRMALAAADAPTPGEHRGPARPSHPAPAGRGLPLPGGLLLRAALPQDLDQAADLLAGRGEPADATDLRLVVGDADEGLRSCAVVVDGERVVSTATLLQETLVLDGTTIPVGQVELVATEPAYEGRGLVRALMGWAHDRSQARGDLAQVMIGIPFFYRQFGYAYAIPMAHWRVLATPPDADPAATARPATAADIAAMQRLQDAAQAASRLRMPHSPACWRWLVARDGSTQWVVERDGEVVATGRSTPPDEGGALAEVAAADEAAARTLLAHAHARAGGELVVQERPGTVAGTAMEALLQPPSGRPESYYARVPRLAPLLEHLAPVLLARLEAAGGLAEPHEVLISSFRSHVRFSIGPDGMGAVSEGGPMQAPGQAGGSGVPPDALPSLLFGPDGASGLAGRLPDCYLGRQAEVMAALFPPLTADLLTFYLPA